ncbi:MAG TPA: FAD-dependent oxidoreductase [Candidatus Cybelea sp.]|nr:FAD-dependent oxidoreductase [Candidatus Cybelea sp.]
MTALRDAWADIAIFGGGIAGLWTLHVLRRAGFAAVLLSSGRLGAGQTVAAQGIIHGGLKYAFDFKLTEASRAIADMPAVWQRCLAGDGDVDLRSVKVLAPRCHFWLPRGLLNRAAGFLASKAVKSKTERLAEAEWPETLKGNAGVGAVYALDEPVLDVSSVLAALSERHREHIHRIDWPDGATFERDPDDNPAVVRLKTGDGATVRLAAGRFIFAAGRGNENLLGAAPRLSVHAQRRPLHMAMFKGMPAPLYAHCFEASDKPRVTITSHRANDGAWVWYIGGELAESGVKRSSDQQIAEARREISELFPTLDLGRAGAATLAVDRAEPRQPRGLRPDRPLVEAAGTALVAWPTKLAFAPALAAEVLRALGATRFRPAAGEIGALSTLPFPGIAAPPWDEAVSWA